MSFPPKRRRFWTFLSLWAVFVLAAPQLLMACPMTGGGFQSTPAAACCCSKKLPSNSSPTFSAANNAPETCCKKVPLPPSDTSGDDEKIALAKARVAPLDTGTLIAPGPPVVISPLAVFELQSTVVAFLPPTFPPLNSQQIPSFHFGRAPPFQHLPRVS